jgi:hypothetical protein
MIHFEKNPLFTSLKCLFGNLTFVRNKNFWLKENQGGFTVWYAFSRIIPAEVNY